MGLILTAGLRWSPLLVGIANPSRESQPHVLGYLPSPEAQGRATADQIKCWTVDVSAVHAVYSLLNGDRVVYIGKGVLGERVVSHFRDDELAGRWDYFTWLSPCGIDTSKVPYTAKDWDPWANLRMTETHFFETVAVLAAHLADPEGNRPHPATDTDTRWLTQVRSPFAPRSLEEKIDVILARLG